jgi:hypothetical protein
MKTAAEYRAMAEECFRWADETHDGAVREGYLKLAQVWLDAASQLDGLTCHPHTSNTRRTTQNGSVRPRRIGGAEP